MNSFIAKPHSRKEIANLAKRFRKYLNMENCTYLKVDQILDIYSMKNEDFNYQIVEDDEFCEDTHAKTNIKNGIVYIKQSIFERACKGEGRDRMTIGHELGHHTMHYKIKNSIFKMPSSGKFKSNCYSPEWQAKCFAGELLMPYEIIKDLTLEETIQKCGVSREAAEYQRKIYNL